MALHSLQQLHRYLQSDICCKYGCNRIPKRSSIVRGGEGRIVCSAIAIDAPSSLTSVSGIRWGSAQLQGARETMEDDSVIVKSDELDGFTYAAVFDGHAGFSSVKFLREELYRGCVAALKGGKILSGKDFNEIKTALQDAFESTDAKLLKWLEESGEESDSGSTATAIFLGDDVLYVSHVGDSCVALSRGGKTEILTGSHRPYGNNKVALQEIRRILEAGGWINNGRICGDISVSRSFGDMRFKTKKDEMIKKGAAEGLWTEKFASRVQLKADLVTAFPDVFQVVLGPDAEFILLASDGLWDYMKSSEVVTFVRNHLRENGDVQMASEALAQMALNQYSEDNICIVIADLGRTDWQSLPEQKQNVVLEFGQAVATIGVVSLGIWAFSMLSS